MSSAATANEDDQIRAAIARNVRRLREARGLSPSGLAAAVGCDRGRIGKIESAKIAPGAALLLRLARILDTTVEQLASE